MDRHFDFVVVGRGMMGAAAARHLTKTGASVALVGRGEPADWKSHDGVFSSHYDSGRITRTIDQNPDWALLANRSIARYRDIEAESGIAFYGETGCLITGA
ncbi:MAG: FAD-dependent oxidoreductase, partial [Shinella sp.]